MQYPRRRPIASPLEAFGRRPLNKLRRPSSGRHPKPYPKLGNCVWRQRLASDLQRDMKKTWLLLQCLYSQSPVRRLPEASNQLLSSALRQASEDPGILGLT